MRMEPVTWVILRWGFLLTLAVLGLICATSMPGRSFAGRIPPLSPVQLRLAERLHLHVATLSETIGQRHAGRPRAMDAAARYIEDAFARTGCRVECQRFTAGGVEVRNVEAELVGRTAPERIVVVGAHYDAMAGSPGADDNASGTAALLELAAALARTPPACTVRFVAFANEEPPFYKTPEMGSRVYAARSRSLGERIEGMVCLECVGCYTDEPGSQRRPLLLRLVYPNRGDFVAFIGDLRSRALLRRTVGEFRRAASLPSQGLATPAIIPGIDWSDHGSFWKEGYRAVMVTDTAFYRYRYYHSSHDTVEKLDYPRMALLVEGLAEAVASLAGRR
jgi:hypothetical protein